MYGISTESEYFPVPGVDNYWDQTNGISTRHLGSQKEFQVDMYLDLKINQLRICLVGELTKNKEIKIWGFGRETFRGWVPHFNLDVAGTEIRLARIPIPSYGLPMAFNFE